MGPCALMHRQIIFPVFSGDGSPLSIIRSIDYIGERTGDVKLSFVVHARLLLLAPDFALEIIPMAEEISGLFVLVEYLKPMASSLPTYVR